MKNIVAYIATLSAFIFLFTGCTKTTNDPEQNIIGTWVLFKSNSGYNYTNYTETFRKKYECDGIGMRSTMECTNCTVNNAVIQGFGAYKMTLKLSADNKFVLHEESGLTDIKGVWAWISSKKGIKLTSAYTGVSYPVTTQFFLDSCTLSITLLTDKQLNANISSAHASGLYAKGVYGTFIFKKEVALSGSGTGTTTPTVVYGTMTDNRDGKTYKTVKIGRQTWMAENLKYQCPGAYAYENDLAKVDTFGYLYSGSIVTIAPPTGWHIPTEAEFNELSDSASKATLGYGGDNLKSIDMWQQPNRATNSTGFSLLPGGIGHLPGASNPFNYFDQLYFTATFTYITNTGIRGIAMMNAPTAYWVNGPAEATHLLSVRYIKNN